MGKSFNFLKAVKNRDLDGLCKLTQDELNGQVNDFFLNLDLKDVKWMGEQFTINLNFSELIMSMKPDILDYFLKQGIRFSVDDIKSLFIFHPENIAVLLKNGVEIPAGAVCGWAFSNQEEELKIYLDNGGNPAICDEDGKSLIECWYTFNGNCEMVERLKSCGCSLSPDIKTMDETLSGLQELAQDPYRWATFQQNADECFKMRERFPEFSRDEVVNKVNELLENDANFALANFENLKKKIIANQEDARQKGPLTEESLQRYHEAFLHVDENIACVKTELDKAEDSKR